MTVSDVCKCGAPEAVHTAPDGGCTWCPCPGYVEAEPWQTQNPPDEWMWLPERGYFR